ncbi:hypothetical protein Smp_153470 [Schistosoma mansoni]|uniref:hypothetical protein n=1 Tax=Schistosoma mansoni TaxID=6183 RepID=UPI0001A63DD3|nr:hypothetical protein Smp_153470 [Schistosoma mansoni]|eukprot:XP_018654822.1 hypothetical protein Smp_153470 [Schistosoma mansoni]
MSDFYCCEPIPLLNRCLGKGTHTGGGYPIILEARNAKSQNPTMNIVYENRDINNSTGLFIISGQKSLDNDPFSRIEGFPQSPMTIRSLAKSTKFWEAMTISSQQVREF